MKKLFLPHRALCAALLIATIFTVISCQKADLKPNTTTQEQQPVVVVNQTTQQTPPVIQPQLDNGGIFGRVDDCIPTEVMLVAGQHMDAGTVTVSNDADNIYVTYTTTGDWTLTETHLYVGDCALIPVSGGGNPVPGQFPYSATHNNVTTYTYTVPISTIPGGSCGCIAAHAVVKKTGGGTETAWGQGTRINPRGGAWGMKFAYCSCLPGE